ncbi:MAG TPA: mycofactocin biosynthesis glycosyltransferase MftF [Acidimicrobiales bacterium]
MSQLIPLAPLPVEVPVPTGTRVSLDDGAKFLDRDLLTGGSPWRLLRLPGGSRAVAERWVGGGEVQVGEGRFARTLVQQGLLHPLYRSDADVDDVDVIVPVRDDVESLATLLESLQCLHVTVVDDASSDADAVLRCARRFGADVVRLEENAGPGSARNAGARATSRSLLWFVDVDVVFDNALDVLGRLQPNFGDPLEGAVAPRIRGTHGPSLRDRFESRFSPLDMGDRGALVVPNSAVHFVPSACLMIRRSSFGEGFDETLRYGEDVDLVWRLHDQGWLVRYVAEVVVTHRARDSWRGWWGQRLRYGQSSSELAKRHGTRLAPFRADTWTLLAWVTMMVGKPMIGLRIIHTAHDQLRDRMLETTENADKVAGELVGRGMVRAGPLMARAAVRTFGVVILISALHPKLRRRALTLFVVGTAYRWRSTRVRLADVPLGVADDVAYGTGVISGAIRSRSLGALKPHITKSTLGLRNVLGLKPGAGSL